MKLLQLVIPAFLMTLCAIRFQVKGGRLEEELSSKGEGWEWQATASSSASSGDVQIPAARPGAHWVEVTPTRVIYRTENLFVDDVNPGLKPNTLETLKEYASALSGISKASFLSALGLINVPQRNAVSEVLTGVILGQVRDTMNIQTTVMFLQLFMEHGHETAVAMIAIVSTILAIQKQQAGNCQSTTANDVLPIAMRKYEVLSNDPISKEVWCEIGVLIDRLMEGNSDAAEEIITSLASKCKDLQRLNDLSPVDQENIVHIVTEDVVNFSKFLDLVIQRREARGE